MDVFTDLLAAPHDKNPPRDHGDVPPKKKPTARALSSARAAAVVPPQGLVVPFVRTVGLGSTGKDVAAVKRALSRAGYIKWGKFSHGFGPFAVRALKRFQRDYRLPTTGNVDEATLRKLAPFFDAYSFLLYVGRPPGATKASRIVAYALWGYNNRTEIGYDMHRPMLHLDDLYLLPVDDDCSEFATKAYRSADAADPNDNDYNGWGNTGSMQEHGRRVPQTAMEPADLVFYSSPDHVAVYVGGGRVVSHGSPGGPYLLPYKYRPVAQVRRYDLR